MNDEIFEGYGDRLEEEELERVIYQPFLKHKVTCKVKKSRQKEGDAESSVG